MTPPVKFWTKADKSDMRQLPSSMNTSKYIEKLSHAAEVFVQDIRHSGSAKNAGKVVLYSVYCGEWTELKLAGRR